VVEGGHVLMHQRNIYWDWRSGWAKWAFGPVTELRQLDSLSMAIGHILPESRIVAEIPEGSPELFAFQTCGQSEILSDSHRL
jgi:hypothetical protein